MSAEVAWAAGLFEGEGSFSTVRSTRSHGRVALRASLEMTDEETVRRFAAVVGCGTIHVRDRAPNRKPVWAWQINSINDFDRIVELLRPWLGTRRVERADELLAERAAYEESKPAIFAQARRRSGITRRKATA